jgi:hypothetical protein
MLGVLVVNDPGVQVARRLESQPSERRDVLASRLFDVRNAGDQRCQPSRRPSCSTLETPNIRIAGGPDFQVAECLKSQPSELQAVPAPRLLDI